MIRTSIFKNINILFLLSSVYQIYLNFIVIIIYVNKVKSFIIYLLILLFVDYCRLLEQHYLAFFSLNMNQWYA